MKRLLLILIFFSASAYAQKMPIVWSVKFKGNHVFSSGRLEDVIVTTASSHIRIPFFKTDYPYDPITVSQDAKRIEHFYQRQGYYQAEVPKTSVVPCSKLGRVCVTFEIDEGDPTLISKVILRVFGASPPVAPGPLLKDFGISAHQIFNHDRYLQGKVNIENALKSQSYPLPIVEGLARYNPQSNTVDISLKVKPGAKARIGYISFKGLDEIRPEDAMAKLPIATGDPFDPKAFDDAKALLASLDVFRSIDTEVIPRKDNPHIVDVIFHVHEKQLKTLQFGGGVRVENSRQELRLLADWINRNFYNHLRRFEIRAEPRYAVLPSIFRNQTSGPLGSLEISMKHPAFLSARQDLLTSVGFDSDLEQGYSWYGPRVNGSLSRYITRRLTLSEGYSFRYLTFYHLDLGAQPSSLLVPPALFFRRSYRLGFIDQAVVWDHRNDPIEPHYGWYAELRLNESAPFLGSGFTYFKLAPEVRGYIPMTHLATFAIRVMYGRLFPLFGSDSPITERFYGGGAGSNRGFAYHRLSPQVTASDGTKVPVGGNLQFSFSLEPRIRLFRLWSRWLIGAVFLDGGDVVASPQDLDLSHLHYAMGPGLRYDTPVGVVRADVGFRLNRLGDTTAGKTNPDPGELYAVHVSFGEAF